MKTKSSFAKTEHLPLSGLIFTLIVFLVSPQFTAQGQSKTSLKTLEKEIWTGAATQFNVTEVPEKWADESAVILAREINYKYRKPALGGLTIAIRKHVRIKLLDQKAVEQYVNYELPEASRFGGLKFTLYNGFRIIKADGTVRTIDIESNSVEEERTIGKRTFTRKKVTLPDLEVGDILDFFNYSELKIQMSGYLPFRPEINTLAQAYPVVYQKISFEIYKKLYVNFKSLNGAPELKQRGIKNGNYYYIEDYDREKLPDARWLYANRSVPAIKFKVTYRAPSLSYGNFLGRSGEIKTEVSKNEVRRMVLQTRNYARRMTPVNSKRYLNAHFRNESDPQKLLRILYDYHRAQSYTRYEAQNKMNESSLGLLGYEQMIYSISVALEKAKVPHNILIAVPNTISSLDDLIFEEETYAMLQLRDYPDVIIGDFGRDALYTDIKPVLQGVEAYVIQPDVLKDPVTRMTVRMTNSDDNYTTTRNIITPDLEKLNAAIETEMTLSGQPKSLPQFILLDHQDIEAEEKSLVPDFEFEMGKVYADQLKAQKDLVRFDENREERKLDSLKSYLSAMYSADIDSTQQLEILENGRTLMNPDLMIKGKYTASGMISKAGPNFILSTGKLFTKQPDLQPEELERDYDAYLGYPEGFDETASIKIPEGYEIVTEKDLNLSFSNDVGEINIKGEQSGSWFNLSLRLTYDTNFVSVENWPEVVALVKEIEQFKDINLLFRKQR